MKLHQVMRMARDQDISKEKLAVIVDSMWLKDGGKGSGNFGHKGRPGQVGGSGQGGGSSAGYTGRKLNPKTAKVYGSQSGRVVPPKMTDSDISSRWHSMPGMKDHEQPTVGYKMWHKSGMHLAPKQADAFGQQVKKWEAGKLIGDATAHDAKASRVYTQGNGVPGKVLTSGTGVTKISMQDMNPHAFNSASTLAQNTMMVDGNVVLTPQRQQLHRATVQDLFKDARKPADGQKKVFTMLGGGSAAGKGAIQKNSAIGFPSAIDSPVIDADQLKKALPEYIDQPDREKAAAYAHEESSALAKRCMQAAIANGYNMTLDGTGDGSVGSMLKKIKQARDAGYQVNGTYVTCPTQLAIKRSDKRGDQTGRVVPHDQIQAIHAKVSQIWPQIAAQFDHTELYDTDQGQDANGKYNPPKLIASCVRGGQIKIHDPKLYQAFLDKARVLEKKTK